MKQRIEYVDLSKGICILLIALTHTYGDSGGQFLEFLSIFKIPVFFMLSGFFFRTYDSFYTFIRKKTNQLLIPILFAFFFFSILWSIISFYKFDDSISVRDFFFVSNTWKLNFGLSPSTWFLLCLLLMDLLYYLIFRFCKANYLVILIVSTIIGIFGFYLNIKDVSLPLWFDTAFTSLPYFFIGNYLWNKTDFMMKESSYQHYLVFIASFLILLYIAFTMDKYADTFYAINRYENVNIVRLYVGGTFGSFFIILMSKFLVSLPIVSYIGRYSIVVLLTHQFYLFIIRNILYQLNLPQNLLGISLGIFLIIIIISLPTIKYGIKYMPYFFAQKEMWK